MQKLIDRDAIRRRIRYRIRKKLSGRLAPLSGAEKRSFNWDRK